MPFHSRHKNPKFGNLTARQSPSNKPAGENSGGRSLLSPGSGGEGAGSRIAHAQPVAPSQEPDTHPSVCESPRPCGTAAHGAGPLPDAKAAFPPTHQGFWDLKAAQTERKTSGTKKNVL